MELLSSLTTKPVASSAKGDKIPAVEDLLAEFDKDFSDYKQVAQAQIKEVLEAWGPKIEKVKDRRHKRYFDIDVESEKKRLTLAADELFTPVAIVNTNIIREQAKYAAYLTKSARSVILSCNEDAAVDPVVLEKDFTQKCRYNAWEIDLLKWIDGTEMHAWDFVEVVFDASKPGHFAIEHCGHENVFFPDDTRDFQASPFVGRSIEYTAQDLVGFVKNAKWDGEQVYKVLSAGKSKNGGKAANNSLHTVQKIFFRKSDGFIYVGWACSDVCDDWLRAPKLLFLGKKEVSVDPMSGQQVLTNLYETSYPIEPFIYQISENQTLIDLKGRVDADEHKQEAATSLLGSLVTGTRRSAGLYFSAEVNDGVSTMEDAQTNIRLEEGKIFRKPLKQFKLDFPNTTGTMAVIQQLIGQSQMEAGDVNYAVQSNKSTRKTAAEVNLAQKDSDMLSGVQVTLLSISMRNVYTRCFDIYTTRVKAGIIQVTPQVALLINTYTWTLKPAGDVDVIERQQKISLMQQSWAVYQQTPAAIPFLINLTKLLFPDEAEQYIQAINQQVLMDQQAAMQQQQGQLPPIQAEETTLDIPTDVQQLESQG